MNFRTTSEGCGCRSELNFSFNTQPIVGTARCKKHAGAGEGSGSGTAGSGADSGTSDWPGSEANESELRDGAF